MATDQTTTTVLTAEEKVRKVAEALASSSVPFEVADELLDSLLDIVEDPEPFELPTQPGTVFTARKGGVRFTFQTYTNGDNGVLYLCEKGVLGSAEIMDRFRRHRLILDAAETPAEHG